MINIVVLVSGVKQNDSVIHTHRGSLFHVLLPFRFLQNTEKSTLHYTVGHFRLSLLNTTNLFYMNSKHRRQEN